VSAGASSDLGARFEELYSINSNFAAAPQNDSTGAQLRNLATCRSLQNYGHIACAFKHNVFHVARYAMGGRDRSLHFKSNLPAIGRYGEWSSVSRFDRSSAKHRGCD
jgi:hypothetical protein